MIIATILSTPTLPFLLAPGSLALIGIYYGFLTTLSIGPSQIISIRALLVEGEITPQTKFQNTRWEPFLGSISGLITAQAFLLIAMYCPSLYAIWSKPHAIALLIPPYMLFYLDRILKYRDTYFIKNRYLPLKTQTIIHFVDGLFFQIINPILFPNPVLARLTSIFLFRYNQAPTFLIGGLIGWLGGQILIVLSCWYLLLRLERDIPTTYYLIRRIVHRIFPPIVFALCLAYLSRTPMSMAPPIQFIRIEKNENSSEVTSLKFKKIMEFWTSTSWPDILFDRMIPTRSLYELENIHSTKKLEYKPTKLRFSQYFFETCVSDGKIRLSHTFPQNLHILKGNLETSLEIPNLLEQDSQNIYANWAIFKQNNQDKFDTIISNKIKALDIGYCFQEVLDNRSISYRKKRNILNEKENSLSELRDLLSTKLKSTNNNRISPWKNYELTNLSNIINNLTKNLNSQKIFHLKKFAAPIDPILKVPSFHEYLHQIGKSIINLFIWKTKWNKSQISPNVLKDDNLKISHSTHSLNDLYKPLPLWNYPIPQEDLRSKELADKYLKLRFIETLSWEKSWGKMHPRQRNIASDYLKGFDETSFRRFNLNLNIRKKRKIDPTILFSSSPSLQRIRSLVLLGQSLLRKYVTLPIQIIVKNCILWLLFNSTEWKEDWLEWSQEIYEICKYDGQPETLTVKEILIDLLQKVFKENKNDRLSEGIQIKIIFPLHIRLQSLGQKKIHGYKRIFSTYLNQFGQEVDALFGKPIIQPVFWRLIFQWIKLTLSRQISKHFYQSGQILKKTSHILNKKWKSSYLRIRNGINYLQTILNKDTQFIEISEKSQQFTQNAIRTNSSTFIQEPQISTASIVKQNETWRKIYEGRKNEISKKRNWILNSNYSKPKTSKLNQVKVRIIHKNLLRKPNLTIIPIHKSTKRIRFFSNPSQRIIKYKFAQMYANSIPIQKKWNRFKNQIMDYNNQIIETKKRELERIQIKLKFLLKKQINLVNNRIIDSYYEFKEVLEGFTEKKMLLLSEPVPKLSQAYVLHQIWKTGMLNKQDITYLIENWKSGYPLKDLLENTLLEKNLLKDPRDLDKKAWIEWLRSFRRYTPSPKIWQKLAPKRWSAQVSEYWKSTEAIQTLPKDHIKESEHYQKLLFQKAKKLSKRWKFQRFFSSYLDPLGDQPLEALPVWNTNEAEKLTFYLWKRIENTRQNKKWNSGNKKILNSSIFLYRKNQRKTFAKSYFQKEVKWKKKSIEDQFRLISERLELNKNKKLQLANISRDIQKILVLLNLTSDEINKEENEFLYHRLVHLIKLKGYHYQILNDKVLIHSMIASLMKYSNKQKNFQKLNMKNSSGMHDPEWEVEGKWVPFYMTPEEILLPKNQREHRIGKSIDFQANRYDYQDLPTTKFDPYQPIPYPITMRKDTQNINEIRSVKRLLWPSHRLEDLCCINRFWIGTLNQNRFSALRIRIYPVLN